MIGARGPRRIAVLSDIHGHLRGLEATAEDIAVWAPDRVVVAGDIVNRGPLSVDCLAFVLARVADSGWHFLRGNHESYVINVANGEPAMIGLMEVVRQSVIWTYQQLGSVAPLMTLLDRLAFAGPDGGEVRIVHGSMRGERDNVLADATDELLREQIAPAPTLFCCSHTHRGFVRRLDQTLVVNTGSAGLPFDGDPRACYARLEWDEAGWSATLQRVAYDRAQAEIDLFASGFMASAGLFGMIVHRELQTARPMVGGWLYGYQERVAAGEISAEEATAAFLAANT